MKKPEKNILLIEYQKETRDEISWYLKENGYKVSAVKDTHGALKYVESRLPDLVITEVSFPKMDVFRFLEFFRKRPKSSLIPVIILSSKIDTTILKKIISYNVDNYIKKPLKTTELLSVTKQLLKN